MEAGLPHLPLAGCPIRSDTRGRGWEARASRALRNPSPRRPRSPAPLREASQPGSPPPKFPASLSRPTEVESETGGRRRGYHPPLPGPRPQGRRRPGRPPRRTVPSRALPTPHRPPSRRPRRAPRPRRAGADPSPRLHFPGGEGGRNPEAEGRAPAAGARRPSHSGLPPAGPPGGRRWRGKCRRRCCRRARPSGTC